jgi:hypothetical protein
MPVSSAFATSCETGSLRVLFFWRFLRATCADEGFVCPEARLSTRIVNQGWRT